MNASKKTDRLDAFHAVWEQRLSDFLPVPCLALGALISLASIAPWRSAAVVVVYLSSNLMLSLLATRMGRVFGLARNVINIMTFVILGWVSGPDTIAWVMAIVGIFGIAFTRHGTGQVLSILAFSAAAVLGAQLGDHSNLDCLVAGGALLSIGWLASRLARVLYQTWLTSINTSEVLARRNTALEHALSARQRFLANMSHEIRTPLNGVLGMTELLARTPLDLDQQSMLETIHDSGKGLLQILNDVLDTAKLDAGKISVESVPYEPAKLAESVCLLMGTKTQGRPLVLRIEQEPSLPSYTAGDPGRLRQVLLNLVGNALKFTEEGEVVLHLSWANDTLKLCVSDTGIGIPEAVQKSIFHSFEQAELGTTRRYGGSGLGLTISSRLVELMGGTLSLESTVGQGSSFTVSLPAPTVLPAKQSKPQVHTGLLPKLVLLVEDDMVNRIVTSRMLETLGCSYLIACNGQEALEAAAEHSIDLVLMDCRMPIMDGFEATRRLRAQGHSLPILALTAGVTDQECRACHEAGMNAVLAKPLTLKTLREALQRQIEPQPIRA